MTDLYKTLRSLRNHERGIRPDPAWVRATRERLLMQVRNTMPSVAAAEKNRKTLAAAHPSVVRVLRGPAFVVCAVILFIAGGSIASVRAAERSLPGDALYTVKLVAEQARLALTPSTVERMKLKAEFTKRRVADLKTVVASSIGQKETRVKQAADILKQDIQTLQEQLKKVHEDVSDSRVATEAARVVDREAVGVVKSLQETKSGFAETTMSPETQKVVANTQAQAADLAMSALGMLMDARKKDDAAKDVMSDADFFASVAEHRDVAAASAANALERAAGVAEPVNTLTVTSTAANGSSLAVPSVVVSVTGTAALAKDAQHVLGEIEALLQAARVDEAVTKLQEGSEKSFQAQSQIETLRFASGMSASSTPVVSNGISTEAGVVGSATSSGQLSP